MTLNPWTPILSIEDYDCHGFEPQGHVQDYAPEDAELAQQWASATLQSPHAGGVTIELRDINPEVARLMLGQNKKQPLVIGLGGYLQHGKDTVADYLVEKHGFVKIGMSDPLADALYALDPLISTGDAPSDVQDALAMKLVVWGTTVRYQAIVDTIGYVEAKRIPEVRRLLQVLGTEVGRDMIDPNVWVNMAEAQIERYEAEGRNVVLTGVRFPNELEMIAVHGSTVWVLRPALLEQQTSSHASENGVQPSDFDYTLYNGGTLEDLHELTEQFIRYLTEQEQQLTDKHFRESVQAETRISSNEQREVWPHYDH